MFHIGEVSVGDIQRTQTQARDQEEAMRRGEQEQHQGVFMGALEVGSSMRSVSSAPNAAVLQPASPPEDLDEVVKEEQRRAAEPEKQI